MARRALFVLTTALFLGSLAAHCQTPQPTRTIVVHARKYAFSPAAITLKKGETTKLVLISDDVRHGLAVRGLGIHFNVLPGQPNEVIVTPAETGDYPGKCSVYCGSGHREMEFMIHVVD